MHSMNSTPLLISQCVDYYISVPIRVFQFGTSIRYGKTAGDEKRPVMMLRLGQFRRIQPIPAKYSL